MSYALGRWIERKLDVVKSEAEAKFVQRMFNRGKPVEIIMEDTGLSRERVEKLLKTPISEPIDEISIAT